MGFEIVSAESHQLSTFPMLSFDVRVENTWGRNIQGGFGTFDLLHSQPNAPRLVSTGWFYLGGLGPNSTQRIRLKAQLDLETIRQMDKLRPVQDDIHLVFSFSGMHFSLEGNPNAPPSLALFQFSDNATYRISLSDWTKFVSPWIGKEVLVTISPETMRKVEDFIKAGIGLRNLDDIIDEFYNRELVGKKREVAGT
ncbi:MAG: hypothetical protein HY296_04555 [Thaumarchaeota archaeon]|nr:hypothetical protein [Nitrososphaerota archaeon]